MLVVEDFDRLTRLPLEQAVQLITRLLVAGVTIAIVRTDRFYDRKALNDLLAYSEILMEISRASQESMRKSDLLGNRWHGKKKNIRAGVPITKACPRWLFVKNGEFKRDGKRIKVIEDIIALVRDGYSIATIAQQLNRKGVRTFGKAKAWTYAEIAYLLKNRRLIGEYQPKTFRHTDAKKRNDGAVIKNHYPAVITEEEFDELQDILAKRAPRMQAAKAKP